MTKAVSLLGMGILGIVLFILLFAALFVIGTAFTAFLVALIWNWIGLHTLFGASALTFWQCVGIGAAINLLTGIFRSGTTVTS